MAADLQAMRTLVRRLTRAPSTSQLSNAEIDEYINTFYLYDLPEELRLFNLKRTFTFWTEPHVSEYSTNEASWTEPFKGMDDFKNAIISIEQPVYVAGSQALFSQSRQEFFNMYPINTSRKQIGTGDGATANVAGTLSNVPVLQNHVSFVSEDANGNALIVEDRPDRTLANPNLEGNLYEPGSNTVAGGIDYVNGDYTFDFYLNGAITAPANGAEIQAQTKPYKPGFPSSILYYQNEFTVRPVPDRAYRVTFDAYVEPTALADVNDLPELNQWWQMLAYGGAKKVFEGRGDVDAVQYIMPEFMRQQKLALRRTLVQINRQQAATIYNAGSFGYNDGLNNF